MDATDAPKQGLLKNWGYYTLWWGLIFAIIGGVLTYTPGQPESLLAARIQQASFGLAFGIACAFVFTLAQNKFNRARGKVKSWIFAVAVWMTMKFAFLFATGGL